MKAKPKGKFCYRCGATKRTVKTYGKMDWCRDCVQTLIALGAKIPDPS